MRCSVCGTYIPENLNYCAACGNAVKGQTVRMIRLICADCYGVIDVDLDRAMPKCPYCDSKDIRIKGDKIRFIRIKEDLKIDTMELYSPTERVLMKQKLDDECDRRYNESAPAIKKNKKPIKNNNDDVLAIVIAITIFIIVAIILL